MIHSSLVPRAQPSLVRKMFTESLMKKMSFFIIWSYEDHFCFHVGHWGAVVVLVLMKSLASTGISVSIMGTEGHFFDLVILLLSWPKEITENANKDYGQRYSPQHYLSGKFFINL